MQCASFVNICVNGSLRRGLGQCRYVLCCDGIIGRVQGCWAVADLGGVQRFPRKPPLKNDCVTIKCFNYRGVRLDRDTLIEQSQ